MTNQEKDQATGNVEIYLQIGQQQLLSQEREQNELTPKVRILVGLGGALLSYATVIASPSEFMSLSGVLMLAMVIVFSLMTGFCYRAMQLKQWNYGPRLLDIKALVDRPDLAMSVADAYREAVEFNQKTNLKPKARALFRATVLFFAEAFLSLVLIFLYIFYPDLL